MGEMNNKRPPRVGRLGQLPGPAALIGAFLLLAGAQAEDLVKAPRFVLSWGQRGAEPGEFDFPIGIAAVLLGGYIAGLYVAAIR